MAFTFYHVSSHLLGAFRPSKRSNITVNGPMNSIAKRLLPTALVFLILKHPSQAMRFFAKDSGHFQYLDLDSRQEYIVINGYWKISNTNFHLWTMLQIQESVKEWDITKNSLHFLLHDVLWKKDKTFCLFQLVLVDFRNHFNHFVELSTQNGLKNLRQCWAVILLLYYQEPLLLLEFT